jgi:hypothetical protein
MVKGALRSVDNVSSLSQYKYSTLSREEQRQKQGFVKNKIDTPAVEIQEKRGKKKHPCEKNLRSRKKKSHISVRLNSNDYNSTNVYTMNVLPI